jgi:hypothetical protein
MSEAKPKVGDLVDVVAVDIGYRDNRLVYPGARLKVAYVKGKKGETRLPKWVRPADGPTAPKAERKNGDLKPADAQAAVKLKAAQLNGEQPPGPSLA